MAQTFDDFEGNTPPAAPAGWTLDADDPTNTHAVTESRASQVGATWNPGAFAINAAFLVRTDLGVIAGASEVLFAFYFLSVPPIGDPICVVHGDASHSAGVALTLEDSTHWNMRPIVGVGSLDVVIGTNVVVSAFATNTLYWAHFGTDGANNWYGKLWTGTAANEPGGAGSALSNGAQCSGTYSGRASGYAGMATFHYTRFASYTQFGNGTAGDIAPSAAIAPPANASPPFPSRSVRNLNLLSL